MKKIIIVLLTMVLCGVMFVRYANFSEREQEQSFAVYSISGENEYFAISNGVMVLTPTEEIFYSGDLEEKQGVFGDVTAYSVTFYIVSGDEKNIFMSNSMTDETGGVIDISGSTGKITGDLLIRDSITQLNSNLYCELKTMDLNGEVNKYQLQLSVTEITGKAEN